MQFASLRRARQRAPEGVLVVAVKGETAIASVWRDGGNPMTKPTITLELRSGRRVVHTRLSLLSASLLAAALLAILSDEDYLDPADEFLRKLHTPTDAGPGGRQR